MLGQIQAIIAMQSGGEPPKRTINTRHMLFIVSGAFDKLARQSLAAMVGVGGDIADLPTFLVQPSPGDIHQGDNATLLFADKSVHGVPEGVGESFHEEKQRQHLAGGFKFTNPNAKASCSCGESFSV